MADRTSIEWTRGPDGSAGATWTPIRARNLKSGKVGWHCEHVSPGCANCYAGGINEQRFGTRLPYKPGHRADIEIFLDEQVLLQPLRWRRPRRIFACSMTDLFADFVSDAMLDRLFAVMALAPQHTFQVLTKRSARMRGYLSMARAHPVGIEALGITLNEVARNPRSDVGRGCILQGDVCHLKVWPLPHIWLGVSAEDQQRADERVPDLLATPAAVRFVSAEPLLGPIDFRQWLHNYGCGCGWGGQPLEYCDSCGWRGHAHGEIGEALCPECREAITDYNACPECDGHDGDGMSFGPNSRWLDWIIVGGESGSNARPMRPEWARSIRDQCASAGVAFHFKQQGAWSEIEGDLQPPGAFGEFIGDHWMPDQISEQGGTTPMRRVGKKAAGRLLDGVEHNGMPEAGL